MKLRIRGNSVRLRIQRAELETLREHGRVIEELACGPDPGSVFRYTLERAETGDIEISFRDGRLRVTLPPGHIDALARGDREGWQRDVPTPNGGRVRVTVEKDYPCGIPRPGEDDQDTFPPATLPCP